ncbi:MAG: TVP38/TMEM64 family protein [Acidobacteria bacterium]|nr:TVP38/TMEM64 family protein [Acidobacteriota bacterium]
MSTVGNQPAQASKSGGGLKLVIALGVVALGVALAWYFGAFEQLKLENMPRVKAYFESLGALAPVIFVLVWIAACVFFLPGLVVTAIGAIVFGPILGSIYSLIGATLGATAAFLIGRYAARDMVAGMVSKNAVLSKIDEGVEKQGWRMLMITRLVPVFPFNAQNYVYGLTKIPLVMYSVLTALFMIPGTVMFNFAIGKIAEDILRTGKLTIESSTFWYLGIAAVLFVLLSLLPGWIKKRFGGDDIAASKPKV